MARTVAHWITLSGESNWNVGANWDIGTPPTKIDDVHFDGTKFYQIDVTDAEAAYTLDCNGSHATLNETASGSLWARTAAFVRGTAILNGDNDFGTVSISYGDVEVGADEALGKHAINFDNHGGTLEAIADVTLHNDIVMQTGYLAAAAGHTLTLDSDLSVSELLYFGSADGSATGTVVLDGTSATPSDTLNIDIFSGTVAAGRGGHSGEANALWANGPLTTMHAGSVLDLTNFAASTELTLTGTGTIENNSNAYKTVDLRAANFHGSFNGKFDFIVTGTNAPAGGHFGTVGITTITMAAGTDSLDLSAMQGNYALYAPNGSTAEINIGLGVPGGQESRFMDFQDGNLTIDTTIAYGTKISWVDNPGGEVRMVVHPGNNESNYNIYFFGVSTHDGFVLSDYHGHLRITYDAAAAETASHDAHVADLAAQAAFVHLPPDTI